MSQYRLSGNLCEMMDRLGCPYEHVETDRIPSRLPDADTRQYAPAKRPDDEGFGSPTGPEVSGAVYFPCGGYVSNPKLSAHNVQRAAERHGAEFMFNAEAVEVLKANGRTAGVVLGDGRKIMAPVVVNVAGPHSSKINAMAGVAGTMAITTRALRHEVAHVPAPNGIDFEADGLVHSDSNIQTYCRPEIGNHILIGLEDPECDQKEWVNDPDNYNSEFSEQWNVLVMRMAQRLQGLRIPSTARGVVALYDVTEDWMPIYEKNDLDGFYMAVGTSGNQFKNAPVAGKMMAALVEACENGYDHKRDPVSIRLEHIDREISLGPFRVTARSIRIRAFRSSGEATACFRRYRRRGCNQATSDARCSPLSSAASGLFR